MKHKHRKDVWHGSQKFPTLKEIEQAELDKIKRMREIRNRRAIARRSIRRDFLADMTRTETDPFTHDKIYKKVDGTRAKVETRPVVARQPTPKQPDRYHIQTHQYFTDPVRTVICHARKLRRRVMFALGLTRRGSAPGHRHDWSDTSRIRCA